VPAGDPDLVRQRAVTDAFFSAARRGDFEALLAVLGPNVVLRIDAGANRQATSMVVEGAEAVARHTERSKDMALAFHDSLASHCGERNSRSDCLDGGKARKRNGLLYS
jgi:RNA polymerase sigma-70 factor (ECF subfamily)